MYVVVLIVGTYSMTIGTYHVALLNLGDHLLPRSILIET